ncbi:MAG TPA: DUF5667 domain-containing protein [Patescibacteria group bacterium]|nr:DUF5667 domain-containing protein [Patescibacteria group bacterium]
MFKRLFILILSLVFIIGAGNAVFAKATPKPTSSPKPTATPVDSFALFWPMSAGKTMQSKVYFLKILKEDARGFFIFGSAQKADYDIFLTIKRMLEAEALMGGNVSDLANKTLDAAGSDLDKVNSSLTDAKNSGDIDQNTKNEINIRTTNLKAFTSSLMNQYPAYNDKLQSIQDKLNSISI